MRQAQEPGYRPAARKEIGEKRGGLAAHLRQVGERDPLGRTAMPAAGEDQRHRDFAAADHRQDHRPHYLLRTGPAAVHQRAQDPGRYRAQEQAAGKRGSGGADVEQEAGGRKGGHGAQPGPWPSPKVIPTACATALR